MREGIWFVWEWGRVITEGMICWDRSRWLRECGINLAEWVVRGRYDFFEVGVCDWGNALWDEGWRVRWSGFGRRGLNSTLLEQPFVYMNKVYAAFLDSCDKSSKYKLLESIYFPENRSDDDCARLRCFLNMRDFGYPKVEQCCCRLGAMLRVQDPLSSCISRASHFHKYTAFMQSKYALNRSSPEQFATKKWTWFRTNNSNWQNMKYLMWKVAASNINFSVYLPVYILPPLPQIFRNISPSHW